MGQKPYGLLLQSRTYQRREPRQRYRTNLCTTLRMGLLAPLPHTFPTKRSWSYAADELAAPELCLRGLCRSRIACGSFGYRRKRSFADDGRVNLPNDETARQWRELAAQRKAEAN
jgi:hypothetical protein